jgi:hypothetical protein
MFTRARLTRWTSALRANPEQQFSGGLISTSGDKMCCLGKLCEVEGLEKVRGSEDDQLSYFNGFAFPEKDSDGFDITTTGNGILEAPLATEFGSSEGNFRSFNMPNLRGWSSAVSANDNGVGWIEIADHFDSFYPCSDEPEKKAGE